ncbi:hypothetical protein HYC85_024248 [Camellia sinensis]|uniref:Myb-like domain-containing protein n=1 Tax=Camellia sinensis TaxID=4442 RepID=A0A7J7G7K3_CAMSI|nr:hypothetical protein HYC85_024248 [Camellia sinensis]
MSMDEQEDHDGRHSRASASRRTRSQVAPDWSSQESLTLITEIAAVERDCRNTLSSFKNGRLSSRIATPWNLNQCRRKWDSLLSKYKEIKLWESSESLVESYWSIDYERRCEFGFLEDFDFEVFKAIDDHLKVGDGSDTDPDVDPEVVADGVAEPVSSLQYAFLRDFVLETVGSAPVQATSQNTRKAADQLLALETTYQPPFVGETKRGGRPARKAGRPTSFCLWFLVFCNKEQERGMASSNKHANEAKRRIKIMLKKRENELPLKLSKTSNFLNQNPTFETSQNPPATQ